MQWSSFLVEWLNLTTKGRKEMIYNEIASNDLFIESLQGERNKVQTYLKENSEFKVIDVGGAMGSWAEPRVDAYLDINSTSYLKGKSEALLFDGNLSDPEGYDSILAYVAEHGKFDFAICTQTLEDIRNPSFVLQMLSKIAKEGYIDVPSKYHEFRIAEVPKPLSDWGQTRYNRGYTGHRWILNMHNKVFEMYPKLPFVFNLAGLNFLKSDDSTPLEKGMLCFWWKDSIEWKIVGDDFLGPNPPSVFKLYIDGLTKGL